MPSLRKFLYYAGKQAEEAINTVSGSISGTINTVSGSISGTINTVSGSVSGTISAYLGP